MKRLLTFVAIAACIANALFAQDELPAGTYYIQNEKTGTYLSAGAQWGTRAVLNTHGIDMKVTVSDGAYTLISQIKGATRALRPSDAYMDQSGTWTIVPLSDGTYGLFNGSNYFGYVPTDAHPWIPRLDTYTDTQGIETHWRFRTKEELTATLASATKENPVDATFFIQAADILTDDYRVTGAKVWGNDLTGTGGNTSSNSYLLNNANAEKYEKSSYNITQKLQGLPNGIYSLSVQAFYRNGSNTVAAAAHKNGTEELLPELYAGTKSIKVKSVYDEAQTSSTGGFAYSTTAGYVPNNQSNAAECFTAGAYENVLTDIVVTDGTLTIGIRKNNRTVSGDWLCFDNFTLLYYGTDLNASKQGALELLSQYEALNTDNDPEYAADLEALRQRIEAATTEEEIAVIVTDIKHSYSLFRSRPTPTTTVLDLTNLLVNADLKQGTSGWTATLDINEGHSSSWVSNTNNSVAVLEAYAGYSEFDLRGYSLLQPVTLSPGMYRLKGYAFYRFGTSYNSDLNNDGEPHSYAYLTAGSFVTPVMRLGDIEGSSYADNMDEAAKAFAAGKYLNSLIFTLDEATTLDVGFHGEHTRYRSWFMAGPLILEKISEEVLEAEQHEDFAQTKDRIAAVWDTHKTITNQALDHSAYDAAVEAGKAALAGITTMEELEAKDAEVWAVLCQILQTGTTAKGQFDLTSLISNSNFLRNTEGWKSHNPLYWNETGVMEEYNKTEGLITQTLKNMPAGNYTLKVQAFYRPASTNISNSTYESGTEDKRAELFLGEASQKIRSINDDSRYLSLRPESDTYGAFGRCVPGSLNGVSDAFRAGQYWNVMRTEVTTAGDLPLGLRFDEGQGDNWLTFDNFRLYYGNKNVNITLNEDELFTLKEDTYANVSTNRTLTGGQLNAVCLPFDCPASSFESVWTLGDVVYDAEAQTLTGTLIPATEVKAGMPYFVRVAETQTLSAEDVLVRACRPDSIPVMWEGAALQGYYGLTTTPRAYYINENGTLAYSGARTNAPGYRWQLNLSAATLGDVKTISLKEIDYNAVSFTVNLENQQARAFLANTRYASSATSSVIASYNRCPPARRDQPHSVFIPVPRQTSARNLSLTCGTDASMADAASYVLPADATQAEISNLVPQHHYYYKVEADGKVVTRGEFQTEGTLRMIKANSVSNIRDLGGWKNYEGNRIRYGLIYRGGEMNAGHVMTEEDCQILRQLGIAAEIDLREDIDFTDAIPISMSALGKDVPYLYLNLHMYGDDALEGYKEQYRQAFNFIIDNLRKNRSIYFHCIWGADRTGALAFLLEGLLGLPFDQIYKDYELTSFSIAGLREKSGLDSKYSYILKLPGTNIQERFYHYWNEEVGIAKADLNDFITRLIDGESAIVGIHHPDIEDEPAASGDTSPSIFSIEGVRLSAPRPGLNIINHRKVLVK